MRDDACWGQRRAIDGWWRVLERRMSKGIVREEREVEEHWLDRV